MRKKQLKKDLKLTKEANKAIDDARKRMNKGHYYTDEEVKKLLFNSKMKETKIDKKKTKRDIEILKKLRGSVNYKNKDGFLKDAKEKRKGKRY